MEVQYVIAELTTERLICGDSCENTRLTSIQRSVSTPSTHYICSNVYSVIHIERSVSGCLATRISDLITALDRRVVTTCLVLGKLVTSVKRIPAVGFLFWSLHADSLPIICSCPRHSLLTDTAITWLCRHEVASSRIPIFTHVTNT